MPYLIALALMAEAADTAGSGVARMTALYDEVCLRAFPDAAAVDRVMSARKARPLTPEQVRVTLHDDPGRGWVVLGAGPPIMVILEQPPYHACSVRALVGDGPHDLSAHTAATAAYKLAHPGFAAAPPFDAERGGIRAHIDNEARALPDGAIDTLMVVHQRVTDASKLATEETAAPLRFVHQISTPK